MQDEIQLCQEELERVLGKRTPYFPSARRLVHR